MEFGALKQILVGVPILWLNARAAGISAPVEKASFQPGASVVLTKFDKGMGVSPSTGLGGTLGFPLSPSVTLGAGLSFTSTGIPSETVGSISSIPVSLTEREALVRLPVWRPGELLTVSASAGVYFYRLAAGDFTAARKLVPLKQGPARGDSGISRKPQKSSNGGWIRHGYQ